MSLTIREEANPLKYDRPSVMTLKSAFAFGILRVIRMSEAKEGNL